MEINKQKWVVGEPFHNADGELELEVIGKKNRCRIARVMLDDFRNMGDAKEIADAIASLPELLKRKE